MRETELPVLLAVHHGDVFDVAADGLVCSANVYLTLSGGVGGELLRRFGPAVQDPLAAYLAQRDSPFTEPGDVVETRPAGTPYRLILHAVAVDGMYDSSPAVVAGVVQHALKLAEQCGCQTVAMPALATGYGRLSMDEFLAGWEVGVRAATWKNGHITLAVRDAEDVWAAKVVVDRLNQITRP